MLTPVRAGFASLIVADSPALIAEFPGKRFALLSRGSRDGFGARDVHGHCKGHVPTLTLIQDTKENLFGGFTPVGWESRKYNAARPQKRGAIAHRSAERFGGEFHGGNRANASPRSATEAVCKPNPAALRAKSAGIPGITTPLKRLEERQLDWFEEHALRTALADLSIRNGGRLMARFDPLGAAGQCRRIEPKALRKLTDQSRLGWVRDLTENAMIGTAMESIARSHLFHMSCWELDSFR
jgi:hypothetical protein